MRRRLKHEAVMSGHDEPEWQAGARARIGSGARVRVSVNSAHLSRNQESSGSEPIPAG